MQRIAALHKENHEGAHQSRQDSVRLIAVDNCVAIGSGFTVEENVQLILPVIRACVNDKSWRVRYMIANNFCEVSGFFSICNRM
jgi:hypothetical protein